MRRVIFFIGVYNTLDLFSYELQMEFLKMGYETMVFDVKDMQGSLRKLAQFVSKPVIAVITFNNLGFNMELIPGKNIWEELQIPCINILVDHPFSYHQALVNAPSTGIVLCIDRNHMKYIQRFYPNISIVGFLPHGGKRSNEYLKPISERTIDVLYTGGLSKSFAENIMPNYAQYNDFNAEQLCKKAYEELLKNPWKTTEQVIEEKLMEDGVYLPDNELRSVIGELRIVELYAVSYFREKTLRDLAKTGIDLYIYGPGWEECSWIRKANVHYGGRIHPDDVIKKMQNSKIVLNTMTWFKDGAHERIFNGMLQKAVVVSDTSVYLKEEFCGTKKEENFDHQNLVLFELEELNMMPSLVQQILDDNVKAQEIAERGYEKACKECTWGERVHELEEGLLNVQ